MDIRPSAVCRSRREDVVIRSRDVHDWANWEATQKHYEIFARSVMPHFQQSMPRLLASEASAQRRHQDLDARNGAAINAWTKEGRLAAAAPSVN